MKSTKTLIFQAQVGPAVNFEFRNQVLIHNVSVSKKVADNASMSFNSNILYQGVSSTALQGLVLGGEATFGIFPMNKVVKNLSYTGTSTNIYFVVEFEELN